MIDKALFLDDYRDPNKGLIPFEWDIVRNYDEFVDYIQKNGLPKVISFDHDLADSHYAPHDVQKSYSEWEKWQNGTIFTEKTGLDCARWLINYCKENNIGLPEYHCHSMNPVGRDNILRELNNF